MNRRWNLWILLFLVVGISAQAQTTAPNTVVIRPVETHDVLTNPGMGITTFQRFDGQALNPLYTWSESGPTTKLPQAKVKPDFPDSTIAYCRWYWSVIEPEPGKFRWDIIDLAIREARAHGQRLAIRLMPYSNEDPLPAWYRNSGARRANTSTSPDGNIWQPDFSDPLYLKYWGQLVAAAGKRYDGNPFIDSIDVSSVGYWGEGWSKYMPAFSVQKSLIDIWLKAFPHTTLLMNFDEPQALAYGTQHGTGWRLDCLGDMRTSSNEPTFPPEMLDVYPEQIVRTGIQNVWQSRPVSLEVCGTVASWKKDGYDVSYILDQALRWHITSLNIKSSPIPAAWKSQFEDFERKMGYRFILRRLQYSKTVQPGSMMPMHMWWLNAGVAPIYRNYQLAVRLHSTNGNAVIRIPVDIRKWLPGDAVVDDSIYIPANLAPGVYHFGVAMLDPETGQPAIRFAIEGRQDDGWYDMGTITVTQ